MVEMTGVIWQGCHDGGLYIDNIDDDTFDKANAKFQLGETIYDFDKEQSNFGDLLKLLGVDIESKKRYKIIIEEV